MLEQERNYRHIASKIIIPSLFGLSIASGSGEIAKPLLQDEQGVVIIDIAPQQPVAGVTQSEYPNNNELMLKVLWKQLKDQLFVPNSNSPSLKPKSKPVIAGLQELKQVVDQGSFNIYQNHGQRVAETYLHIAELNGVDGSVTMLPLQHLIDPDDIEFYTDASGSQEVLFNIKAEPIINAIAALPEDPAVVNMSFMMGESKIKKVAGKNGFKIESAFGSDNRIANMREFFTVARSFPDTLFIAAGGNSGENLDELQNDLGDEWVDNAIFTAAWQGEGPTAGVIGADIYVLNSDLDLDRGSSFSAPVVAERAYAFAEQGMGVVDNKAALFELTEVTPYSIGQEQFYGHVLPVNIPVRACHVNDAF